MRARHRHFNPAHAGASFALDSRYGFTLSDGNAVDTWDDRSTNNIDATQSTSGNRPTYKTNIQGGQPVVRFLGSNNNFLDGNTAITNGVITTLSLFKMNSTADPYCRIITTTKDSNTDSNSATRVIPILRNNGGDNVASWRNGARGNIASASVNTWNHYSSTFDNTNCVNRLNESTSSTSQSSGNFDINKYRIGSAFPSTDTNGRLDGDIASISFFNLALSNELRKRVQFAAAFSFKVSCN